MRRAEGLPSQRNTFQLLGGECLMWNEPEEVEYLYLPDGRVIRVSNDSTDYNLFLLWLAISQQR